MAFYILPPSGDVNISTLEKWAFKRLSFLLCIYRCHGNMNTLKDLIENPSSAEDSDCLIEGTTKDAISHFILRLVCAGDSFSRKVFVDSETMFFFYRVKSLSEKELVRYIRCLRRFQNQLRQYLDSTSEYQNLSFSSSVIFDIWRFLTMLTEIFDWRTLIHHYVNKSSSHFVAMPFEFALELVAKRQVVLHRGKANVPCTQLPELLRWFFKSWLSYGMNLAEKQLDRVIDDRKMERLFKVCNASIYRLRMSFHPHRSIDHHFVADDIDTLNEMFPPCMNHLHQMLRRNHRLKHHSTVIYTLFLKDLGLSVDEAVSFWRKEYSQPFPTDISYHGCKHLWQKDERRLVYGIHHLYGLKGSRIIYSSHSCRFIQNEMLGPGEECSCPFNHTHQRLNGDSALHKRILDLSDKKENSAACFLHLESKTNEKCKRMNRGFEERTPLVVDENNKKLNEMKIGENCQICCIKGESGDLDLEDIDGLRMKRKRCYIKEMESESSKKLNINSFYTEMSTDMKLTFSRESQNFSLNETKSSSSSLKSSKKICHLSSKRSFLDVDRDSSQIIDDHHVMYRNSEKDGIIILHRGKDKSSDTGVELEIDSGCVMTQTSNAVGIVLKEENNINGSNKCHERSESFAFQLPKKTIERPFEYFLSYRNLIEELRRETKIEVDAK